MFLMNRLSLTKDDWDILKLKLLRKYNHLTDQDLAFEPGQEQALIERLALRLKRDHKYVLFTLQKGLSDLNSNRL